MMQRTKLVMTCHVLSDGVGDFTYLTSICNFISSHPEMHNFDIVAIVICAFPELINGFDQKLKALNISKYYLATENDANEKFLNDDSFKQNLSEADQIIMISSNQWSITNDVKFKPFLNDKYKFKFIGEHEFTETLGGINGFSLGLSDAAYGLKLQTIPKIKSEDAFAVFRQNDPVFANALLNCAKANDAEELFLQARLIPAYYNKSLGFFKLLGFVALNKSFQEKNIIFNLSGLRSAGFFEDYCNSFKSYPGFSTSKIKQLVYIRANEPDKQIVHDCNPEGTQTIYILDRFNISDLSFKAVYQQAAFAGVSGDNTLELAISADALPYYHSTNADSKKRTLSALVKIIQYKIQLPESIKQDFMTYFGLLNDYNEFNSRYAARPENKELLNKFGQLNLIKMFQYWPVIADYLKRNYNYYDKLEAVIKDFPVENNLDFFNRTPNASLQTSSTMFQAQEEKEKNDPASDGNVQQKKL